MSSAAEKTVNRILTEDVLTISEAREKLFEITGRKPDKATVARWIHNGAGGIKLEAVRIGSQLLVSSQSLNRFITARTGQLVNQ